jgi:hypothetical protein
MFSGHHKSALSGSLIVSLAGIVMVLRSADRPIPTAVAAAFALPQSQHM